MDVLRLVVLVLAVLATGLHAGLYYTFAIAVMPGIGRTGDRTFVEATQHVNRAILNGWFALAFAGAPILSLVAALLHLGAGQRGALPWVAAGFALNLAVFVITMALNVPLNNALDRAGDPEHIADHGAVRTAFERPWSRLNVVRALVCLAAFAALTVALVD
ncbi:MAG: DUF1772 domain-containing protein [Streptosporangiales bacterium]|nr:DUF1772 domain-containing protein [Streptosporangiales bacterium]